MPTPHDFAPLAHLDEAWRASSAGERLRSVRRAAPGLRERIQESGRVAAVRTFDLILAPYPTRFGFGGAATSPIPYVLIHNRATLVQYGTLAGEERTLLFNPTDAARSAETPFFRDLRNRLGEFVSSRFTAAFQKPKPHEQLAAVGLSPEDVDYIAFDHLHTQDLRGTLGTGEGLPSYFPRAKMLVWRPELEILRALHPLQAPWYVRDGVRGVPEGRFAVCDGDFLLGRGVALVRTPGHTVGNWSLVINTDRGVWAVSENGISCDNYAPEASRIAGLRRAATRDGAEVVLNSNTLELRNEQYTSMVLEKALVDRCPDAPEFCQHFASSELTPTPVTPGLWPTYRHRAIHCGVVRPTAPSSGARPHAARTAEESRPG